MVSKQSWSDNIIIYIILDCEFDNYDYVQNYSFRAHSIYKQVRTLVKGVGKKQTFNML